MTPRLLLRMSRWARRPPSTARVVFGLAVVAVCLALAAIEWLGWWPEALRLPPRP